MPICPPVVPLQAIIAALAVACSANAVAQKVSRSSSTPNGSSRRRTMQRATCSAAPTHTIPPGDIGNEKPIVIVSERWFSPELHVVVLARSIDPRAGETSYRLVNVKREEPPPELFRVPADYTSRGLR